MFNISFFIVLFIFAFVTYIMLVDYLWKKKTTASRIIAAVLVCAPVITVAVLIKLHQVQFEREQKRINEIEQEIRGGVNRQVHLWEYEPFAQGTRALWLEEESTLQLIENLPRLDGATALYPVYAAFVQAVYPHGNYGHNNALVQCNTTAKAYERLLNGSADIIFVAGASEEHMEDNLVFTPIGREAFVFFVNAQNPVDSLTTAQIRAIYSGEITNWKEIGGEDVEIMPYQREANSGSQTAMEAFMGNTLLMKPPIEDGLESHEMHSVIVQVEAREHRNRPNAIGYSFLFFATEMVQSEQIKLLEIDGVAPTRENVANGSYPHADYFYAVTVAGNENPNVELFIEWILGEQGQYLIEKTGYTRLN
jgi:phosphate transport system substrate-binding protein